jgi:hypothetical protein
MTHPEDYTGGFLCGKCGSRTAKTFYTSGGESTGCDQCLPNGIASPVTPYYSAPHTFIVAAIDRLTAAVDELRKAVDRK